MDSFSIGIVSYSLAIGLPLFYLIVLQLRRFGAWVQRDEPPKERAVVIASILTFSGFFLGGFAQPIWNKGDTCYQQNQPVITCVFFNG